MSVFTLVGSNAHLFLTFGDDFLQGTFFIWAFWFDYVFDNALSFHYTNEYALIASNVNSLRGECSSFYASSIDFVLP